ncbi:hypothetical protein V5F29_07880 [Xanthobacter aminoxidans]|uniref:hypothetical protein n=1 Tax=Xanthobacter aminoxidans TaxID=186280 RepID=UPI00372ACBF7
MHDDLQLLAAQDEALVCLLIACVRARAAHAAKLGFFAASVASAAGGLLALLTFSGPRRPVPS